MKLCVFSDIHGNFCALDKMLKAENNNSIDMYFFLGDIFGYFDGQKQIFDVLLNNGCISSLLGNHDNYYLNSIDDKDLRESLINKYGSSYSYECTKKELDYVKNLKSMMELHVDGLRIGFFHGGINDPLNERVYPNSEININTDKFDILFYGHTHYKMDRVYSGIRIINPGSLGQPRDGTQFSYCIFDTNTKSVDFKYVDIDIYNLIDSIRNKDKKYLNYLYILEKYKVKL